MSSLSGKDRFSIVGRLGAGGMGVVYRVHDSTRGGEEVALKLLSRLDAAALYRFKQEFRALADVLHPNLVQLFELITRDEQWMFTMELIDGVSFQTYVRGDEPTAVGAAGASTQSIATESVDSTEETQELPAHSNRKPMPVSPATAPQVERLRGALAQLVEGVRAIHHAGKLHRDIKPRNVLVERTGRVVILDFGLATSLSLADRTASGWIVGAPTYMAPEQVTGRALTEAADWYAVGVMIYQALSGTVPFLGEGQRVLEEKVARPAVNLEILVPDAPADLASLCNAMLERDPSARPSGDEIRRRLVGDATDGAVPLTPVPRFASSQETLLVGRERELSELHAALAAVRAGEARSVHVSGASGMGKSALVNAFLQEVESERNLVVLRGRCYEQESVPYKALDSLIDALTRHLLALPEAQVWQLMSPGMPALARLFPVLRRVEAVLASSSIEGPVTDPVELRRHAFAALRELLRALSRRATLILSIDDLQWGDTESAGLLKEVFRSPDPPEVLLLLAYRPEHETSAFLRAYPSSEPSSHSQILSLRRLPLARARDLAAALLRRDGADTDSVSEAIARESGGSPFFVRALVHHLLSSAESEEILEEPGRVSLEDLLRRRVDRLPHGAARILQLVSVAAQPIQQALALTAAGLGPGAGSLFAQLRREKLVISTGIGPESVVETAHDRIRESVVSDLAPGELRDQHRRLATALEAWAGADPEALAVHLAGAGEERRAAGYLVTASANAFDALAFDRAANLLAQALQWLGDDHEDACALWARLGETLGHAGRSADAARAYLEATARTSGREARRLRSRAAEHLLCCGKIDQGMRLLYRVLSEVGIRAAPGGRGQLIRVAALRARLRLRGLRHRPPEGTPDEEVLERLEACWTAAIGYSMVDTYRAVEFQIRYLLMALDCGEPIHVAMGLVAEACMSSLTGPRARRRAKKICERAVSLADETGDPVAMEWAYSSRSFVAYQSGEWREARAAAREGIELFSEYRTGFAWQISSMRTYYIWCLYYLGEAKEMTRLVDEYLRDARDRGDLYTVANLSTGLPSFVWLVRDQPETARERIRSAMSRWSPLGVHLQHFWEVHGLVQADLYEGDWESALDRIEANWPRFRSALFLRIRLLKLELLTARATALVMSAASGRWTPKVEQRFARDLRYLEHGGIEGFRAIALALRAGMAAVRGDPERACDLLDRAIAGLEEQSMSMHAAAAKLRRAQLSEDRGETTEQAQAIAWFENQGVRAPRRLAQLLVPGPAGSELSTLELLGELV